MTPGRPVEALSRAAILLCALTLAARPVRAQTGSIIVAKDARAAGRGGTDVAIAESPMAVLTNPAGLAFLERPTAYAALRLFEPRAGLDTVLDEERAERHLLAGPSFGFAAPVAAEGDAEPRLVAGFGFAPEAGFFTDIEYRTRFFPEGVATKTDYHILTFAPGAALRLTENLSVGASLHYYYSRFDVSGPVEQSVDLFKGEVSPGVTFGDVLRGFGTERIQARTDLKSVSRSGFGGEIGALFRASRSWSLGAFYRPPGFLEDFEGDVELDFTGVLPEDPDLFPEGLLNRYDAKVSGIRYPQSAGLGAAWRPAEVLRLSADLAWIDWSNAFRKLDIELTGSENSGYDTIVGGDSIDTEFPLEWRDQWVMGLGAEWEFADRLTARAGVSLATSPVPRRTAGPLTPGFARTTGTLGLGWEGDSVLVDAAYLHTFRETIAVGPESLVSDDFEGGEISFSNWSFVLGVTVLF